MYEQENRKTAFEKIQGGDLMARVNGASRAATSCQERPALSPVYFSYLSRTLLPNQHNTTPSPLELLSLLIAPFLFPHS